MGQAARQGRFYHQFSTVLMPEIDRVRLVLDTDWWLRIA